MFPSNFLCIITSERQKKKECGMSLSPISRLHSHMMTMPSGWKERGSTLDFLERLVKQVHTGNLTTSERFKGLFALRKIEPVIQEKISALRECFFPKSKQITDKQVQLAIIDQLGELLAVKELISEGMSINLGLRAGKIEGQSQVFSPLFEEQNVEKAVGYRLNQGISDVQRVLQTKDDKFRLMIIEADGSHTTYSSPEIDAIKLMTEFFSFATNEQVESMFDKLMSTLPESRREPIQLRGLYLPEAEKCNDSLSIEEKRLIVAKQSLAFLSVSMLMPVATSLIAGGVNLAHSEDTVFSLTLDLSSEPRLEAKIHEKGASLSYIGGTRGKVFSATLTLTAQPLEDIAQIVADLD
jgi:predicted lactoylglutathione lyase